VNEIVIHLKNVISSLTLSM